MVNYSVQNMLHASYNCMYIIMMSWPIKYYNSTCILTTCTLCTNSIDAAAPPTVTATPLSEPGKIRVSWTPPTPPTGSTITGYSIQYRIGSSGDYTTATDPGRGSTSTTISGLQLGRTYQVRVGARTEIGIAMISYQMSQATTYNGEFMTQCKVFS